jgi:hypothetical protein
MTRHPPPAPPRLLLSLCYAHLQDVWEEEVLSPSRDVKSRVAGMLRKERLGVTQHSWDDEEQDQ